MAQHDQNKDKIGTVAVGLSGGVDSSVAALLLKEQGYNVLGLFMQNWESDDNDPHCSAEQDLSDAQTIADTIGIPLHTVNFTQAYWDRVFQHCLDEFAAGRTPNPDVWCNREIKFSALLSHAKALGADRLATGHYARIEQQNDEHQLLKGVDENKDQSYFLYMLNQAQLANSLFPLGNYHKTEIRQIAKKMEFINHAKKDSTGICFIGERKFKSFLKEFLLAQPGDMETPDGKYVGRHDGVMFYTIGQRKGLQIGGRQNAEETPWYVVGKNIQKNVLIVAQGDDHPLLFSKKLICSTMHWIKNAGQQLPLNCSAKTRYRQPDQACRITRLNDNEYEVEFEKPQRAITPGQSIVFYNKDVCLGGAIIESR